MRHPPRAILMAFGLKWYDDAHQKTAEKTGKERPKRDLVITEFLRNPPDNFPDRYNDNYIRQCYWHEIGILLFHLYEETKGWLTQKVPQEPELPLFKELPAIRRQYTIPEGGSGPIRDKDTDKMTAAEVKEAWRQTLREARQLGILSHRLERQEATAEIET